jgi:hypothetical protein
MSVPRRRRKQMVRKQVRVPDVLALAVQQFNGGRFFECHETLEEVWQNERGPLRNFYKGLIHVAVAFVHIGRQNYFGGNRLFRTAQEYLAPYRETGAMGFDVARLLDETRAAHAVLIGLGKAGIAHYDLGDTPKFRWRPERLADEARRWGAWGFDDSGAALEMTIEVAE